MTGRKTAPLLTRTLRLALGALALWASAASAQEIRVERVGVSAPVGGAAAAAPSAAPLGGLGLSLPAASLSAPSLSVLAAPSAAVSAAASPAAASPASVADAAPAAAVPAAVAAAPPAAAAAAPAAAPRALATPSGVSRSAAPSLAPLPAAADSPRSADLEREDAERSFAALTGERLIQGRGDVSATPVAPSAAPGAAPSRLERPSRARFIAAVPAILAAGLPALHPSLSAWHVLSQAGYLTGNVGAAIFPLVEIYEAYTHGKAAPKSRAIVGAVASLALGLVAATILHKGLWGVQNIFGGLTLLVPLVLRAKTPRSRAAGLKRTALITVAAAAVSLGIYAAAAATVPAALGALFSAAVVAKVAMVVQFATSAMFLWMFLPDVVKVMRGKAAEGFSTGFNLMFFLSALGSMVWAVPSAWIYSGADQGTYRLIFAVNAIYALASFLSFWFARRAPKTGGA